MTYVPNLSEFVVLALGSVGACAAGAALFWVWSLRSRTRPFTLTLAALFIGCAVFGYTQYTLYRAADSRWNEEVAARTSDAAAASMINPDPAGTDSAAMAALEHGALREVSARHFHIFLYGAAFALLPLWFYSRALAASLADQPIESAFAMSAMPDEYGPFRAAQAMARRGDIEGAVVQYRSYSYKQDEALLSAARLLQNDGRYDESAALYTEVMENYGDTITSWSEACFELAKLKDSVFGERQEAMRLLGQLVERNPDGEHGHLAIRMQRRIMSGQQDAPMGTEQLMSELDAQFEATNRARVESTDSGPTEEQPSTP